MSSESLLCSQKFASHEVVVNLYLTIFTRTNDKLVILGNCKVHSLLIIQTILLPYGLNLDAVRIHSQILQLRCSCKNKQVFAVGRELDFRNNFAG